MEKNNYMLFAIVRMHLAHKTFLTFFPLTIKETLCRLGRKVRLVARNEWLRLWPNIVVLPQASHFAMINIPFIHYERLFDTRFYDKQKFYHNPYLNTRNIV